MGTMNVICDAGDIVVEWDAEDAESVKRAHDEWKRLKADGYEFYEPVEAKGKRLAKFNAKLGRVIAAPGVKKPAERKTGARAGAMAGGPNATGPRGGAFVPREERASAAAWEANVYASLVAR